MPRRPPKRWWKSCVKGVEKSGGAYDPKAVCGAVWADKSDYEKRNIVKKEERRKSKR